MTNPLQVILSVLLMPLMLLASRAFAETHIAITRPMTPPGWAVLERELLRANTEACKNFFAKYFDERGYLLCVERWGGDDGPDDAIENCNDWPILHALGADDVVLQMYKKAWEGHLRQFTEAKTVDVPFAREGMYFKEFPVKFDWLHNSEGLTVFNLQGLSDPNDVNFGNRVRRYAGFYMNEDPGAPNYDPKHKIIRSLFNGSRGPLMRKATGLDWAGDPIEVKGRFSPRHGEDNYEQMVAHFKDYNDIVGDHPINLLSTSLALNAYMLTGEKKYRDWLIEYVDAWVDRQKANGYIIPSNIGLDGTIGGETDGKWYGGVYGWAFTVEVPQDGSLAHRNIHHLGFTGFMNAFMLTGDPRYLDGWRKQIDKVNAQKKVVAGKTLYPHMYGDQGWYDYKLEMYGHNALEIYYLSMEDADRERFRQVYQSSLNYVAQLRSEQPKKKISHWYDTQTLDYEWVEYLAGRNPTFPETALRTDFRRIRKRAAEMRTDTTTPDTRLADDPMHLNPASIRSLLQLTSGGIHPKHQGNVLQCRLRYFDPIARRAGLPDGVAALVDELTADQVSVTLVNTNQSKPRTVVVQAGGYAEHHFLSVSAGGKNSPVKAPEFTVHLAPGAGERLTINMKRFANVPTMRFPWDRWR